MKTWSFILLLVLAQLATLAQSEQIFLNRDFEYAYQAELSERNIKNHDAIKPFLYSDFKSKGLNAENSSAYYSPGFPFKSLSKEDEKSEGQLSVSPILDLGSGFSFGDSSYSFSNLGIGANALFHYTDAFTARISFSAHRGQYPEYLNELVKTTGRTPEGHVWHTYDNGYNYTDMSGYLSWTPNKFVNFQLGHGKNFIGNGYRSLMLSDHAGNNTYGRILVSVWKIKYMVLYNHLKDVNNTESRTYGNWRNKYSTSHYLSVNLTKWLNVGLFESVVWKAKDTLLNRGYDVNYLNPIIFFRPVEYSTGSSDNSILGFNLNVKPAKNVQVYGQFVLDEFLLDEFMKDIREMFKPGSQANTGWWANKYAWQLGFKYFDAFKVKGLGFQSEINWVRPFTYSHSDPIQNYGHQNASMAHPLGANFMESVSFVNYQKRNWFFQLQFSWYNQGLSTDSVNYGEDIYRTYNDRQNEYGHVTAQGIQKRVNSIGFRASYLVYPETNIRVFGSIRSRNETISNRSRNDLFFQIGVSSLLNNRYNDI